MVSNNGWIKLHRKIAESPIFADPDIFRLWVWCLMKASHKETRVVIDKQVIDLQPGQFVTGRSSLSEQYNSLLSKRKKIKDTTLWNWMKKLQDWGNIDIKSTNKYSVITVVKWSEYQDTLTTDCQQIDGNLTTDCQQIDTNKNYKNLKNVKEVSSSSSNLRDERMQMVIQAYEREGYPMITSSIVDEINIWIDEYPVEWITEALKEGSLNSRRFPKYVSGILNNWKVNGGMRKRGEQNGGNRPNNLPFSIDARIMEEQRKRPTNPVNESDYDDLI